MHFKCCFLFEPKPFPELTVCGTSLDIVNARFISLSFLKGFPSSKTQLLRLPWHTSPSIWHSIIVANVFRGSKTRYVYAYGSKCLGKIMTYSMSFFLNHCHRNNPYCTVWPNPNILVFSGNFKQSSLLNR